jgi:hypothetical protein
MNCLQPLKHWNPRFETHWRHECLYALFCVMLSCVYVEVLRRAYPQSKESYRLCIRLRNWKAAETQQRAVEPLLFNTYKRSGDSSDGLRATGLRPGFDFRQGNEMFLLSAAFREALGPIQPLIQSVSGAPYLGINLRGAWNRQTVEVYLHSLICLHGVVLS